jgi:hypothetical protein
MRQVLENGSRVSKRKAIALSRACGVIFHPLLYLVESLTFFSM